MGELIGAIAEILGIYLLHALGRFFIYIITLGTYTAEPYDNNPQPGNNSNKTKEKQVPKATTMVVGFVVLVFIVVIVGINTVPKINV